MQSNNFCCTSFCGLMISAAFLSGIGRAFLFTFWFWFSGILSICMVTAGTTYGGFVSLIKLFKALISTSLSDTTYAAIYFPPPCSSKATTVASLIPGYLLITSSTSESSIRKPLILTWESFLPMIWIFPSGRYLATSPEWYITS